jgi:hypothetical protein
MKMEIRTLHDNNDNGADLVGLDFMDDGVCFTITGISTSNGKPTLTYIYRSPQTPEGRSTT